MIRQEQLAVIIDAQHSIFLKKQDELIRETLDAVPILENYATIITGIRRCGKSTLLLQLLRTRYEAALYINFEDIRLVGFDASDFTRLHNEIVRRKLDVLFFDEIQLANHWEVFVHQLLREGYTVFVTGSNAALLSKELGTHLTGRHLSMELFPFSYREFIAYQHITPGRESLEDYLLTGGLPEYVKTREPLIISSLMEDIIVRDIAVRHAIRDVDSLKQLAVYLLSNVGKPVSANRLTGLFGIRSGTTVLEYFNYFRNAYLIEFLPQFSYSLKAQSRNPKKVYAMDNSLISAVSTSFTEDLGRKLENLVYLHLRRTYQELYFYAEGGECDFVAFEKGRIRHAIQVCFQIDDSNFEREYQGLVTAMKAFGLTNGTIVTLDQTDHFEQDEMQIAMVPAHVYLNRQL